ncbi:MAG: alpha/beta fold hydrolase [Egibacteraceae bacterium]
MQSRTVDLEGPVHFVDFGGPGNQGHRPPVIGDGNSPCPVILCVHGLGGSHVNWVAVGPALARRARVLAIDLPGFGRTPLSGRRTGVRANRSLLDRFIAEVIGEPAIVMGNSMGGTIAILEAACEPARVAGLILVCPSVPKPFGLSVDREVAKYVAAYAIPGMSQRILRRRRQRLGPEGMLLETLRVACVDPGRIPRKALNLMVDFAYERSRMPWADVAYLEAARSLVALHTRGKRHFMEMVQHVEAPTLFIQGAEDRLATLDAAEQVARSRPDWAFAVLDNVGHLPMLEDPRQLVETIDTWLGAPARAASSPARSSPVRTHNVA